MRNLIVIVLAVAVVTLFWFAALGKAATGHRWPTATEVAVFSSCVRGGSTPKSCGCVITKLEALNYSVTQLASFTPAHRQAIYYYVANVCT